MLSKIWAGVQIGISDWETDRIKGSANVSSVCTQVASSSRLLMLIKFPEFKPAQIVVAAELTNNAADSDRLPVLLAAVKVNLGKDADQVLADAGFRSEAVFEQLKDSPSELIVALGREGKQALEIDAGQYPRTAAMQAKFKTPQAQAAYRKRKWIVEAPNGWIKSVLGFRQFSLRGLDKVKAEFKLVCLALNLRRTCSLRAT